MDTNTVYQISISYLNLSSLVLNLNKDACYLPLYHIDGHVDKFRHPGHLGTPNPVWFV